MSAKLEDPAGELVFGDEDAGEEVERQQQGVDDRRGGVLGGDRRGERNARQQNEAAPMTRVSRIAGSRPRDGTP